MSDKLRKSYRLDTATVNGMVLLARLWGGPVMPLDQTAVIDEMVRRCLKAAEIPVAKKTSRKSRAAS